MRTRILLGNREGELTASYDSRVLANRFGLSTVPTVLARTASLAPVGISRLKSCVAGNVRAQDVPAEDAFTIHVALKATSVDLWVGGKHVLASNVGKGKIFIFDLHENPVPELHTRFDFLRFYFSQISIDELSIDVSKKHSMRLLPNFNISDQVMHGVAQALLEGVEQPNERSALFIDHIVLAVHAHLINLYGSEHFNIPAFEGKLAPWQLRRAIEFISCHLDEDPTVAQLAQECRLSVGYFARAFRRTTGMAPHQWLTRRRVAKARELLLKGDLELVQIASICGFVDQSHFTRVFKKFEDFTPGQWRKVNSR